MSKVVFKKLQKINVLGHDGTVHTENIGPNLTHHLAKVPAYRQKQMIDLLFWWEEDCQRLRKLYDEKVELMGLVQQGGNEMYGQMLERVAKKMKTRPSERDEKTERNEDGVMLRFISGMQGPEGRSSEAPPAYL